MKELLLAWLKMSNSSMAVQTIPTIHHFVFCATSSTVVFRINQCVTIIRTITTETFIMSIVGKMGAPLPARENIDVSSLQAVVKSGERKNTQVTLTKKNVTRARIKFCAPLLLKNGGAKDAETVTTGTGSTEGTSSGAMLVGAFLGLNSLSMQR